MKHVIFKITFDPLDFLEYFCPEKMRKAIFGHHGISDALNFYTINPKYAETIARKHGLKDFKFKFSIDQRDITRFVEAVTAPTTCGTEYLATRGLELHYALKYGIGFYSFNAFKNFNFGSLKHFYLFNEQELKFCQYKLAKQGLNVDLLNAEYLVIPSYDKEGKINNIAFRVLDPLIEENCAKWIFSHGRQATFGLDKIDKKAYVVEGFFDALALWECGYPTIGLGSAFPSDAHWEFLKDLDLTFIFDNDEVGVKYSGELFKTHKVLKLSSQEKDPFDQWIKHRTLTFEEW